MTIPDNCTVRLVDLPYSVGGMITEDIDGHANIYINARYGSIQQVSELIHELTHNENDDLRSQDDIHEIEACAESAARSCG